MHLMKRSHSEASLGSADRLPGGEFYLQSLMHRDIVTHVLAVPRETSSVTFVTGSRDGQVRFWQNEAPNLRDISSKSSNTNDENHAGLEFMRSFKAHNGPLVALVASGDLVASVGIDCTVKVYNARTADMMVSIKLSFSPSNGVCWVSSNETLSLLLISERDSPNVWLYDVGRSTGHIVCSIPLSIAGSASKGQPVKNDQAFILESKNFSLDVDLNDIAQNAHSVEVEKLAVDSEESAESQRFETKTNDDILSENSPINLENQKSRCFVKCIARIYNSDNFLLISNEGSIFQYHHRSLSDKEELIKLSAVSNTNVVPIYSVCSPDGRLYAILGVDQRIRIYKISSNRLYREFDESPSWFSQKNRLTPEQISRESRIIQECVLNFCFDESGSYILVPSAAGGIRVLDVKNGLLERTVGLEESGPEKSAETPLRFLHIALFQGVSFSGMTLEMLASENPALMSDHLKSRIILLATSLDSNRFFIFGSECEAIRAGRDVQNERLTNDLNSSMELSESKKKRKLPKGAVIYTTLGDIQIDLIGSEHAPRTVENFCTLSARKYYDGVLFHRVIKGFMIQTGDPKGNGTGGQSMWGSEFADEFHPSLRHSPNQLTVSMANAGPNTNGSQFFITTSPDGCPWLDDKHTVFGRVSRGQDVVMLIDSAKVDESDKPVKDIRILQIEFLK